VNIEQARSSSRSKNLVFSGETIVANDDYRIPERRGKMTIIPHWLLFLFPYGKEEIPRSG